MSVPVLGVIAESSKLQLATQSPSRVVARHQSLWACASCDEMVFTGLLVRVPVTDVPSLRRERIVVLCRDCGSLWVRPDGSV